MSPSISMALTKLQGHVKNYSVKDVPDLLFRFLKAMDAEATSLTSAGHPTGLQDYGRHCRKGLSKPQNEVEWSKRLAELLIAEGIPTELECDYRDRCNGLLPGRRQRLDLLLKLGEAVLAVEVKGAWSDYWGRRNKIYRSYLLHPLVIGLDATKTHTVPYDLLKLSQLRPPQVDYIGQLLIGFECPDDPMDSDVDQLIDLAGLDDWESSYDQWSSPSVSGQRVRCWFWWKSSTDGWSMKYPTK
jgi:hypothetical protein